MAYIPRISFSEPIVDEAKAPTTRMRAWMDRVTLGAQTLEGTDDPEDLVNGKIGERFLDTFRSDLYFKSIQGGKTGWLQQSRVPNNVIEVFTINDFPIPVPGSPPTIQLVQGGNYFISADVDIGGNQILLAPDVRIQGYGTDTSILRGSLESDALIDTNGEPLIATNVTFVQDGASGILINIDMSIITGISLFTTCTLARGVINLTAGFSIVFRRCRLSNGCRIVQLNGGGVSTLLITDGSGLFDSQIVTPASTGLVTIETNSRQLAFNINQSALVFQEDSVGIFIEGGADVLSFDFEDVAVTGFGAISGTAIVVENPNDADIGEIRSSVVSELFTASVTLTRTEPVIASTLASIGSTADGICQDFATDFVSGNLMVSETSTDTVRRYQGLSITLDTSITITDPEHITWFRGDLYVRSSTTITRYVGFSADTDAPAVTVTVAAGVGGFFFIGENLATVDSATKEVIIFDGFSSDDILTIDLTGIVTTPVAGTFDGVNLLILNDDDQSVFVMKGVSNTVQYSFLTGTDSESIVDCCMILDRGQTDPMVGFIYIGGSALDAIQIYDHPVTFDHSSPTWELTDIPGIIGSSDRGGSEFSLPAGVTEIDVTLENGVWADVSATTEITYTAFSEYEKMTLNNEFNGEIVWLASRDRGRNISASVTFDRGTPAAGNVAYEVAIVINTIVIKDSILRGVIKASGDIITLTTLPISRDLVIGDRIKVQMRRLTGDSIPGIFFSKVAIT